MKEKEGEVRRSIGPGCPQLYDGRGQAKLLRGEVGGII